MNSSINRTDEINNVTEADILTCQLALLANQTDSLANQTAELAEEEENVLSVQTLVGMGGTIAGVAGALFAGFSVRREGKNLNAKNLADLLNNVYDMQYKIRKSTDDDEYTFLSRKFITYMDMVAYLTFKGDIKKDFTLSFNDAFSYAFSLLKKETKLYNNQGYFQSLRRWCREQNISWLVMI